MKKDLKISTLAIICVLCTAVSGAYAASSVRSLGGSGTYSSVSSAASAGDGGSASVRGGSLRVTPSAGQSGASTTIDAGTTTTGRVATSPRLSIGHYLGGATSVSGGSSLRPQTPGSGSSSGGSSGGGISDGDLTGLRDQIDQLGRDVEDLRTADDNINDALSDKQDTLYPGEDGFIIIDDNTNEIFVDVDALEQELEMIAGKDGREVELGSDDTDLLWRYVGENDWNILISKAEITGPQGPQGEKGEPGDAANLDAYSTTEQMNQAIGNAIAALADVYATKDDLTRGLAAKANAADVYTKAEVYNKTEVDEKVADIVAGDMDEALANKADKTYVDEQLATKADKTELANKADASAVSALETEVGEINDLASDAALAAANAISGLDAKENISNKTQTVTNSATEYPSGAAVTTALADKADKSELANYATNDSVDTKLENYYTISEVDDKVADVVAGDMGEALIGKEDKSNKIQTIDASSTADQYPSAAAVYGALEQKADTTTVEQIEQNVTNVTEQVTNLGDTINNADTGLKKQVEDAVNTANAAQQAVAGKQDALGFTPEDAANKSQTVVDDETKYPSSAAVYGELETKANVSDLANYATTETVNQIEQNVTNVTEQVTNLGDTINNEDTGLKKQVEDAVSAAEEAKTNADAAKTTADEAKAGLDAKEDKSNKATSITAENQSSGTAYPTVGAITQWTNTKINELSETGLPVNPDNIGAGSIDTEKLADGAVTTPKIADNAVTEDKLSDELNAEIDGKEDKANLKALAYKDQITNADVADDAAIEKSKLALDVQTALDNAADAVSMSGATPNSVLGADDTGNPVWYEIAM